MTRKKLPKKKIHSRTTDLIEFLRFFTLFSVIFWVFEEKEFLQIFVEIEEKKAEISFPIRGERCVNWNLIGKSIQSRFIFDWLVTIIKIEMKKCCRKKKFMKAVIIVFSFCVVLLEKITISFHFQNLTTCCNYISAMPNVMKWKWKERKVEETRRRKDFRNLKQFLLCNNPISFVWSKNRTFFRDMRYIFLFLSLS